MLPMSPALQTSVAQAKDPCPICYESFDGRTVKPVVVKTECDHSYDLQCISQWFERQPLNQRTCVICRDKVEFIRGQNGRVYQDHFFPDPSLLEACIDGDDRKVEWWLSHEINITSMNTHLVLAVENGRKEIVGRLIDKGADVKAIVDNGATPLTQASQQGHKKIAFRLIDEGADINAVMDNGSTPLMLASQNGHKKIAFRLIDEGADINAVAHNGTTPLTQASCDGHKKIAFRLIDEGADINAVMINGATPLMLASQYRHTGIVKRLVKAKAKADIVTPQGFTALTLARARNHTDIVDILESYMNPLRYLNR